ncbi:MAG: pantoate--beta-alanine ligase [Rickettsiales bacterium]|nr:pantoate--beta-alanine ligase [Rickettsiales bacterium]
MQILNSINSIRQFVSQQRQSSQTIAFVPTMGALHEGHLSLIDKAKEVADCVVVSIFVNPKQFGQGEDYDTYPNMIEADQEKLKAKHVDVLYIPNHAEMYPQQFLTHIHVDDITQGLCSLTRPHFFDGVAIVVTKLLMQVLPDVAVFGEKDYQQLLMVQRLVEDLNIPTQIIGGAVMREADGLAMSSRNMYLSEEERAIAPSLFRIMNETKQKVLEQKTILEPLSWGKDALMEAGFMSVDYYDIRDAVTLKPISDYQANNLRLIAAVHMKSCRLIDNISLS